MLTDPEGEIWDELFELADRAQQVITKYTVCIYVWQKKIKRLAVAGTGVLLRVGDRHFLLSAAHVLDLGFHLKMPMAIQPSLDSVPPIPLNFVGRKSSDPSSGMEENDPDLRDSDPLDISLAELTPDTADKLAIRHRFLTLNDVDPLPPRIADGMYVFGYPSALAKPGQGDVDLENWPLGYVTTVLQHEPDQRDKNKEILLYFPLESRDLKGTKIEAPPPDGLSGCGIWRLSRAPVRPAASRLDDMRLVGIQHRWRSSGRYLIGTGVKHILDFLWGCYPDLRSSLVLWRRC